MGFEHRNTDSKVKHSNHYTIKELIIYFTLLTIRIAKSMVENEIKIKM